MNRIVHLSLKVDDVQGTGDFYHDVFGFQDAETRKTRDHLSRHMTEGHLDFTLMKYDAGTQSKNRASGRAVHPPLRDRGRRPGGRPREIRARGCEVVSDPGVIPVKFRAPAGRWPSWCRSGATKRVEAAQRADRIVHLSLKVDDVQKSGDFYKEVFGFRDAETRRTRDHVSRHMTDGEIDFTLMKYDAGTRSKESLAAGEGPVHPSLRDRGEGSRQGHARDRLPRLADRERPRRDPGEIPRPRRHHRRAGAARPLQALERLDAA